MMYLMNISNEIVLINWYQLNIWLKILNSNYLIRKEELISLNKIYIHLKILKAHIKMKGHLNILQKE